MLRIERLCASYSGSLVLRDVELEVPRGQVTCLMGRNGVGKTTLLKCIMGLLPLDSGAVRWGDKVISGYKPEMRARLGIGYVPQGREIFPHLTVEENIRMGMLGADIDGPIPASVYELFPKLRDMLGRKGGVLSGGEQQQLAFARVLVARPKVLLLDEPTEGIQPSIILQIESVIGRLKQSGEMGILLVEQYLDFAQRLADRFAIMSKGAIVSQGGIADLKADLIRQHMAV